MTTEPQVCGGIFVGEAEAPQNARAQALKRILSASIFRMVGSGSGARAVDPQAGALGTTPLKLIVSRRTQTARGLPAGRQPPVGRRRPAARAVGVGGTGNDGPQPRVAFVFGGGGSKGAAQVGMLRAIVERGIVADAVYGTSAGAINAAAYASDPTPGGVDAVEKVWRGLTRESVFPAFSTHVQWRFFQRREAVYPNDGLRNVIESGLLYRNLEDMPIPLHIVTTDTYEGQPKWLERGPAVEALLASAAIPGVFPPVVIGGVPCIDGGVVDNVPLAKAVAGGATRVFVLLCAPLRYEEYRNKRPVEAVLSAFFLSIHSGFRRDLADLPAGTEAIVFTVAGDSMPRYDDFSATDALISEGYRGACSVLDAWERGLTGEVWSQAG